MKKFALILIFISVAIFAGWYWYEFKFPFNEFSRMGEIQFPRGTEVLEWHNGELGVKGRFQIPIDKISEFVTSNNLSNNGFVVLDTLVVNRCIHDGSNLVQMSIVKQSGIVDINIQGPDHSGDKPCNT